MKIVRISGEGIDADFVETTEFEWPHYEICVTCENETRPDGWCTDCEQYADGRLSELKSAAGWL